MAFGLHKRVFALGILASALFMGAAAQDAVAQGAGDLVVSPTRVVFEGRDRSAQISLANRGSASAIFRISVIDMVMDQNGELRELQEPNPDLKTAGALVRYAPRQIEIAPGATQIVRLSLRKPSGLADGEYRSHIFFRAVPPERTGRSVTDDGSGNKEEVRIELIPIYGITIPLIVRQGTLTTQAGFESVQYLPANAEQPARLDAVLTRAGSRSTFGDLRATYKPNGGGEPIVVGQITRLAVYTPNEQRRVVLPLRVPEGITLANGAIELTYRATEAEGGEILATSSVSLN